MSQLDGVAFVGECVDAGPQSIMERMLLDEYLQTKGHTFAGLKHLPEAWARALMIEACQYASLKLAQVESTANFREKIRGTG